MLLTGSALDIARRIKMTVTKNAEAELGSSAYSDNRDTNFQFDHRENYDFPQSISDLENNLFRDMAINGFPFNGAIKYDSFIRFSIDNKLTKKDEFLIAHNWFFKDKPYLAATYGTWTDRSKDIKYQSWDEGDIKSYSEKEQKEFDDHKEKIKKQLEKETKKKQEEAAEIAKKIENFSLTPTTLAHEAYLTKKGISHHGIYFDKYYDYDSIIIPLRNAKREIRSLQYIFVDKDGEPKKRFLSGGQKTGLFFVIGKLTKNMPFFIAEGYATGASIYECLGVPVVVAFDCNNLEPVLIELLKSGFKAEHITITGDDDVETEGNRGRTEAEYLEKTYKVKVKFPEFTENWKLPDGKLPTDFNDLHKYFGGDVVRNQLMDEWYKKSPIPFREVPYRFNVNVLPEEFKRAVLEEHRFIKASIETMISIGMTVINTAIGKSAYIVEVGGVEHYTQQGYANILHQGERKSQIFKNMAYELDEYEKTHKEEHDNKVKRIKAHNIAIDDEIKSKRTRKQEHTTFETLADEIADLECKKLPIPPSPRIYSTDVTEQRLFELMEERDGEYSVLAGEGRVIVNNIIGSKNKGGETNDSIYLSGISGEKITRDRIGTNGERIEKTIHDPCLNLGFMVQPDKWNLMVNNEQLKDSGFLARLFVVYPSSAIGYREIKEGEDPNHNKEAVRPFHERIRHILESKHRNREIKHSHKVLLTDDVAKARIELHNEIERDCRPGKRFSENNLTRGIASKFTSQTCKIALALHIFKNPNYLEADCTFITKETWNQALELGRFFLEETLRAIRINTSSKRTNAECVEEKLIFWLYDRCREGKSTQIRDITMGFRPRKKADEVEKWVKKLEEHNCARLVGSNVELHPYILENGTDWLKHTNIIKDHEL